LTWPILDLGAPNTAVTGVVGPLKRSWARRHDDDDDDDVRREHGMEIKDKN